MEIHWLASELQPTLTSQNTSHPYQTASEHNTPCSFKKARSTLYLCSYHAGWSRLEIDVPTLAAPNADELAQADAYAVAEADRTET